MDVPPEIEATKNRPSVLKSQLIQPPRLLYQQCTTLKQQPSNQITPPQHAARTGAKLSTWDPMQQAQIVPNL